MSDHDLAMLDIIAQKQKERRELTDSEKGCKRYQDGLRTIHPGCPIIWEHRLWVAGNMCWVMPEPQVRSEQKETKESEIEITDEMLEAGVETLLTRGMGMSWTDSDLKTAVGLVYFAMRECEMLRSEE